VEEDIANRFATAGIRQDWLSFGLFDVPFVLR
jgi:hypothetical protein